MEPQEGMPVLDVLSAADAIMNCGTLAAACSRMAQCQAYGGLRNCCAWHGSVGKERPIQRALALMQTNTQFSDSLGHASDTSVQLAKVARHLPALPGPVCEGAAPMLMEAKGAGRC